MTNTENFSSGFDQPPSSLYVPQGNPPPLNPFTKLVDDLITEILLCLPNPRSSSRCKAVCKRWRSLISDPTFNPRFISHHQSRYQPASLFLPSHNPQSMLSFLPLPDKALPALRAFDCFKDLLLCGFADLFGELGRSYLLCNPFTNQWVALPLAPKKPEGGHNGSAVVLVCQPHSEYNFVQQPEPKPAFVYSEYRFRVVCHFQCCDDMMLHVFCSESRKWTKVVFKHAVKRPWSNVTWWKGRMYWMHLQYISLCSKLAAYDPFRLDIAPQCMRVPPILWSALCHGCGNFSVSQGAFHIVVLEVESVGHFSRDALTVWRLEEDTGNWILQYELVLKKTTTSSSLWGELYELDNCFVLDLHPEKPEVVFFKYLNECVFSCNLRTGTGEPEFFSAVKLKCYEPGWRALQPRVSCWPTPIPRYEELRGMYDGSYDCWVQSSRTTTLASKRVQPLVEQFGRKRKDDGSAAALNSSKCCVQRKQKVARGSSLCP
ncbi:unnamed protein product [Linum tenue]|uniref:F-box domain-containing protein n=1 Tax=Linum tenue TaxID=586396 RepID=A0AAV0NJN1_9ROSI|nr:unnamed protein product [Linum tenue]